METEYRILTDIEKHDANWYVGYDVLVGPNGFECGLTEPEDRIWYRDLQPVVLKLNEQYDKIDILKDEIACLKYENENLREKIFLIEEWEGKNYKDLK